MQTINTNHISDGHWGVAPRRLTMSKSSSPHDLFSEMTNPNNPVAGFMAPEVTASVMQKLEKLNEPIAFGETESGKEEPLIEPEVLDAMVHEALDDFSFVEQGLSIETLSKLVKQAKLLYRPGCRTKFEEKLYSKMLYEMCKADLGRTIEEIARDGEEILSPPNMKLYPQAFFTCFPRNLSPHEKLTKETMREIYNVRANPLSSMAVGDAINGCVSYKRKKSAMFKWEYLKCPSMRTLLFMRGEACRAQRFIMAAVNQSENSVGCESFSSGFCFDPNVFVPEVYREIKRCVKNGKTTDIVDYHVPFEVKDRILLGSGHFTKDNHKTKYQMTKRKLHGPGHFFSDTYPSRNAIEKLRIFPGARVSFSYGLDMTPNYMYDGVIISIGKMRVTLKNGWEGDGTKSKKLKNKKDKKRRKNQKKIGANVISTIYELKLRFNEPNDVGVTFFMSVYARQLQDFARVLFPCGKREVVIKRNQNFVQKRSMLRWAKRVLFRLKELHTLLRLGKKAKGLTNSGKRFIIVRSNCKTITPEMEEKAAKILGAKRGQYVVRENFTASRNDDTHGLVEEERDMGIGKRIMVAAALVKKIENIVLAKLAHKRPRQRRKKL